MAETDRPTRVALRLSAKMSAVAQKMRDRNPVGFGKRQLTTPEYRARWIGMSESERQAEMESVGFDDVADRLKEDANAPPQ